MTDQPIVNKTRAASGRVDYTQPVVIRGGGRATTHLEVLPTFVKRTGGERACLKISYWKKNQGAFRMGYPAEFSLNEDEILKLRSVIDLSLALRDTDDGQYLMIPLADAASTDLRGRDSAVVGKALLELLRRPGLEEALAELPSAAELVDGIQTALRIRDLESGIAELETALDTGVTEEHFYQKWCERNAWAFGNAYTMRDEVRDIALGDSVDILLRRTTDQFRDIFELKRPDHDVLFYDRSHKSFYWSQDTSRTIGQTHRYLDALHETAANGLRDHPEILAYYPYGTIIIGRSNEWSHAQQKALHGLNSRLHSIRVITYDHLLEQAKRSLSVLRDEKEEF